MNSIERIEKTEKEAKELIANFYEEGDKGLSKKETHINYNCAKQCAVISIKWSLKHLLRIDTIENIEELVHLRAMKLYIENLPNKD